MGQVTLYLPKDLQLLYDNLEDGEASRIFQQALKEHCSAPQTVEEVQRKLDILYQDQLQTQGKVAFLEKKRLELQQKEKDLAKQKVSIEEANKKRQDYLEITCKNILLTEYQLSEKDAQFIIKHLSGMREIFSSRYKDDIYLYMKENKPSIPKITSS
jgi:hypothetical protein